MNLYESADLLTRHDAVTVLGAIRFLPWSLGGHLFVLHYALTAFGASVGVVQIGVASSGLRGLWFFPNRRVTAALGILFVVGAFAWFFTAPLWVEGPWGAGAVVPGSPLREWGRAALKDLPAAYNLSDAYGGLSGPGQGLWFPAGAVAAVVFTIAVSSLVNRRMCGRGVGDSEGVQALAAGAYSDALRRSLRYWRGAWRSELSVQLAPGAYPRSLLMPLISWWLRARARGARPAQGYENLSARPAGDPPR